LTQKELRASDPKRFRTLQRKASKARNSRRRHIILRRHAGAAIKLDAGKRTELGTFLVHIFCESTNIATVDTITKTRAGGVRSETRLLPNESTSRWLEEAHANEEAMRPSHPPMVVPPLDWTNPSDGGYRTEGLRLDVVKSPYSSNLGITDISRVLSAVNRLQRTPWAVNAEIYEVMYEAWDTG